MSESKGIVSLGEKGLDSVLQVFNTMWSSDGTRDLWHWLILILVVMIATTIVVATVFKAINKTIELLVKLVTAYKSSGLPMLLSTDKKFQIRRRKQFCNVMIGDLVQLSRAENWNDQNFTDLEAEVEIEGGYYASAWDALRRKKSYGLRKEPSLIKAITSSAERALQLVGEPGSGKSVALRHLAAQVAERGKRSNSNDAPVPLYINLREMEVNYTSVVSADDVREFVLDNIRRGDADTSSYVRENWADYCDRGIWLFLFDSFDEIPAVLHAPVGSAVIKQYSEAIRQFLDGMGECKGILASREFKGPEALPWQKLRILPLSGEKQDELIGNSVLPENGLRLVRQHLASSHSSTGATPLFLTLLCRYVRDEKRAPHNDHDILLRHIDRLASREPEHLMKKYQLTVEELVRGAERLARLFAENDNLSLAPTLDQIKAHLPEKEIPSRAVDRLVLALVDCKIGRADVPNANNGDRRFAFAHRRYQEALFVGYLAKNPSVLSNTELLTDPRWREYAVTLLQTCEAAQIQDLLDKASEILEERAELQVSAWISTPPLPTAVTFYDWENETAASLLALLQEGLARRLEAVPIRVSEAVHKFLEPRWTHGDTKDRCEVLRLGGLLPQAILLRYLSIAFSDGTMAECAQAFRLAVFARDLPKEIQAQVLEALSDEALNAKNRAEQLSIEALAARLPETLGASVVVERANKIRRRFLVIVEPFSAFMSAIPKWFLSTVQEFVSGQQYFTIRRGSQDFVLPPVIISFFPLIIAGGMLLAQLSVLNKARDMQSFAIAIFLFIVFLMLGSICFPYMVRARGTKLTAVELILLGCRAFRVKSILFLGKIFSLGLTFLIVSVPCGFLADWVAMQIRGIPLVKEEGNVYVNMMSLGSITLMAALYVVGFLIIAIKIMMGQLNERRWSKSLENAKCVLVDDFSILYSALEIDEMRCWLKTDGALLNERSQLRGFSSLILHKLRYDCADSKPHIGLTDMPACFEAKSSVRYKLEAIRQVLENKLHRLD